ncbi:MAG: type II secretion system protein GspG [Candidatus Omnitrophica bacterium]|nr:type II secretion system protein GspG [Candidatus Omnitrophota bacterium]
MRHLSTKGLTLIELITVIAILAILASMIVGAGQFARKKAARTRAESDIANLELALSAYKLDFNAYPEGENKDLVDKLSNEEYGDSGGSGYDADWNGPYMNFKEKDLNSNKEYLDPWGVPYTYKKPGDKNKLTYDIISAGPDKAFGTNDDIANY